MCYWLEHHVDRVLLLWILRPHTGTVFHIEICSWKVWLKYIMFCYAYYRQMLLLIFSMMHLCIFIVTASYCFFISHNAWMWGGDEVHWQIVSWARMCKMFRKEVFLMFSCSFQNFWWVDEKIRSREFFLSIKHHKWAFCCTFYPSRSSKFTFVVGNFHCCSNILRHSYRVAVSREYI